MNKLSEREMQELKTMGQIPSLAAGYIEALEQSNNALHQRINEAWEALDAGGDDSAYNACCILEG